MGTRIYYIPASKVATAGVQNNYFSRITEEVERAIPNSWGFLPLADFQGLDLKSIKSLEQALKENTVFYYFGKALHGIVGDMNSQGFRQPLQDWKDDDRKQSLLFRDRNQARIGRLSGGVLHQNEYERFRQDGSAFPRELSLQERRTAVIKENNIVDTVLPWDRTDPVYYIPVYRCHASELSGWEETLDELLHLGLIPVLEDSASYRELTGSTAFWTWLEAFWKRDKTTESLPDGESIETALAKIKRLDYERAHIPIYTDEIFQMDQGCWDLWAYRQYRPENPPPAAGWLNVSDRELYARDPRLNIAADGEWAAVDFGTRSTMVAVWYKNGVHMRRVGMQGEEQVLNEMDSRSLYENPTILRFQDIDSFLAAYRGTSHYSRPETKFKQISVSNETQSQFTNLLTSGSDPDTRQFQEQIKQWTNDPDRSMYLWYQNDWQELKYSAMDAGAPDPVEIYAYYIGLYLNNLLQGKIYLKYLLSYSATYFKGNLDRFQTSFERGLRKSLPKEILEDPVLGKKFEVKLYLDEATAYAVSALLQYRTQAAAEKQNEWTRTDEYQSLPKLEDYTAALQGEGLFYGVFDFGGGTLDYSFGRITRENGKDIFQPLERGGASSSGCENILEDMVYKIFDENRKLLISKKIFCLAPPWLKDRANNDLIRNTSAARYNTFSLLEKLRKQWIDIEKCSKEEISFRLRPEESNDFCNAVLWCSSKDLSKDLSLKFSKTMEDFFSERIQKGVEQFLWQFQYTAKKHGLTKEARFIFLGGNASRSEMVLRIFEEQIRAETDAKYFLHPPLPTDYDQKRETADVSYPSAKSGVVHGLLEARPYSSGITVHREDLPFRYFQYHIGRRVPDDIRYDPGGLFDLVASAYDLAPDLFCLVGQVPANGAVELLYTRKPEYGFRQDAESMLPAAPVSAATILVPPKWDTRYFLYCRPAGGSDTVLELWLSSQNSHRISDNCTMETLLGWFACFPQPEFTLFAPDAFYVRFVQDGGQTVERTLEQLSTEIQKHDPPVFYAPGPPMRVQYGTRIQLDNGTGTEFVLPAELFQKEAALYCGSANPSGGSARLCASSGDGFQEFILDLWRKSVYPQG